MLTDHEVERALGYTPCICGVIDGTWHDQCYRVKRNAAQKASAHKAAMKNARAHVERLSAIRVPSRGAAA